MPARAYLLPDFPADHARHMPLAHKTPGERKAGFATIDVTELPNGLWEVTGDHGLFGGRFRSDEHALRFAIEEGRTYRGFVLQMKAKTKTEG